MKMFLKMLIIAIAIVGLVTVSYLNADHKNGGQSNWEDDGTGYEYEWGENSVHTGYSSASVFVSSGRTKLGIPYTEVYVSAFVSTKELNADGELNRGKLRVWTSKTGPDDGRDYEGIDNDDRSKSPRYYFRSPKECGGMTLAGVYPRHDPNTVSTADTWDR